MQRTRSIVGLVALLGLGTAPALGGQFMSQYWSKGTPDGVRWGPQYTPQVPTVQGAWGEPVEVASPYNFKPPNGSEAARAMLAQSMPLDLIQQSGYFKDSALPILPVGGQCAGGVCPVPGMGMPPGNLISPPGIAGMPPGAMPPGMGGMSPSGLPPGLRPPGAVAAVGALTGGPPAPFPVQRTEVRFVGPPGMKIAWYGPSADGRCGFGPQYLEAPARYNFLQASIYRLKLSNIPNHPALELYPTLEVVPGKQQTCTFLAHSAVPIAFTEEDFMQVAAGNFVVKVIYLPDPQFQDLAATGPDEVVSSRLEPGVDPIVEAKRRGSILLVVRMGNIDLQAPNTPAMDAPNPFAPVPPGAVPGMPAPPGLPPYPGVPMAGMPGMPGMPNQMAPNMPPPPPMAPYGMLNSQPPSGMMDMRQNPGTLPPAGMLPPPGGSGTYPIGTPMSGQPGTPLGGLTPSNSVQSVQYLPTLSSPPRRPTLAELAPQSTNWGPPPTTGTTPSVSR